MSESRAEYQRDWRGRQRATRQERKAVALAAIDSMLERAAAGGPEVFRGVLEAAHVAREAVQAA